MTQLNQYFESVDDFFDRTYINFKREKAVVYQRKIGEGQFEMWSISKVKKYLKVLTQRENKD